LEKIYEYHKVINGIQKARNEIAHQQTPGHRTIAMEDIFSSLREVAPEGSHYSVDVELEKIRQNIVVSPRYRQEQAFVFPS
jgi:hypothetical protein